MDNVDNFFFFALYPLYLGRIQDESGVPLLYIERRKQGESVDKAVNNPGTGISRGYTHGEKDFLCH